MSVNRSPSSSRDLFVAHHHIPPSAVAQVCPRECLCLPWAQAQAQVQLRFRSPIRPMFTPTDGRR